jgi:hypothetical protein
LIGPDLPPLLMLRPLLGLDLNPPLLTCRCWYEVRAGLAVRVVAEEPKRDETLPP